MKSIFLVVIILIISSTSFAADGAFQIYNNKMSFPDGSEFLTAPKDGKSILNGSGAPSITGNIGDFYIDTTNNKLYGPYNGGWGSGISLVGPIGASPFTLNGTNAIYTNGSVGIGTTDPSQKLTVAGTIESTTGGVKFPDGSTQSTAVSINYLVPIGSLVPWWKGSGLTPALPSGWVECNGQVLNDIKSPLNGRTIPNLNGEAATVVGDTTGNGGFTGTNNYSLSTAELPAHNHTASNSTAGNHNHSGTTDLAGVHNHTFQIGPGAGSVLDISASSNGTSNTSKPTAANGNHNHTLSISANGDHTHSVTVNNTGSGTAFNNMQRSSQMTWIMRVW